MRSLVGRQVTDFYRLLEVDPAASPEVIAAAYRVLAKRLHPDIAGPPTGDRMVELNRAYETLRDPVARARYDQDARSQKSRSPRVVYMRFGRYRGVPMSEVPTDYLLWVVANVDREGDIFDASQELLRRGFES